MRNKERGLFRNRGGPKSFEICARASGHIRMEEEGVCENSAGKRRAKGRLSLHTPKNFPTTEPPESKAAAVLSGDLPVPGGMQKNGFRIHTLEGKWGWGRSKGHSFLPP